MKFFVDTANLSHIKEAADLGILDGVTTNPSLMAKEGIKGNENILKHYADICALVDGDVSAEVLSTDFESMVAEGKALAAIHPNIVVKVPMIKDPSNGLQTMASVPIARWYFLQARQSLLQKQVQPMFHHSSAV